MERQAVTSSNVASVGYDAETETLEVEFNNGSVYQYLGVPVIVHAELITASSIGRYLNTFVKGTYAYQPL